MERAEANYSTLEVYGSVILVYGQVLHSKGLCGKLLYSRGL